MDNVRLSLPERPRYRARTVVYVFAIVAAAWLFGLSGFLPGRAGAVARAFLLENPDNAAINVAFVVPAMFLPILLTLRHGRTTGALAAIAAFSYIVAMTSQWALRHVIRPWAPLEEPPFDHPFWSLRLFLANLIVVAASTLIAASWRRVRTSARVVGHDG